MFMLLAIIQFLEHGHGELAEYLISLGMDVNSPSKGKLTPVHFCGIHGKLDLCTSF
jgi:ankyrin repeat protein